MTPDPQRTRRRAPGSDPDWLTLGQAAKYLGVAQSTIRKWSDQEFVPAEGEGYSVKEAESACEGLAALDAELPDLILLDVMMPEVDGWQMLQHVQERHGVGAIPVIRFSGQADAASATRAEERGVQRFVGKPFDAAQLVESTKQLLPL